MTQSKTSPPVFLTNWEALTKASLRSHATGNGDDAAPLDARADKPDAPLPTVKDVALTCRAHPKTVRLWIKRGELAAVQKGRWIRITKRALTEFLKTGR